MPSTPSTPCVSIRWAAGGATGWWTFTHVLTGCNALVANDDDGEVDYAKEFDDLRNQGLSLQEIVDHFLRKDEINRQESMRKARLRAQAKIDSEVNLRRRAHKDQWGIALHYSYRH